MGLFGDIASGILGAVNTGYNLYTNKRDFDYQKALQQQIFEREDTAVQRRMADLEAAGINPNLAAGSPSGAGAVVGRSSTNDVNMGSVLDTLMAKRQIEQQKLQQNLTKQETTIAGIKALDDAENYKLNRLNQLYMLGFDPKVSFGHDGKMHVDAENKTNFLSNTMFGNLLDYQLQNAKNSADLLQKDNNWYTADKISGMALGLLGAGTGTSNWRKVFNSK